MQGLNAILSVLNTVAKNLLELDEVRYVGKSIGEHTIDLRVETIVKDNVMLLDLLELIKGMDGVNDVVWSEIVSVIGRKNLFPHQLLINSDNLEYASASFIFPRSSIYLPAKLPTSIIFMFINSIG